MPLVSFVTDRAQDPVLALELSGALAQINWGGWKLIGLPALIRFIHAHFSCTHSEADLTASRLPPLLTSAPQNDYSLTSPSIVPLAMRTLAALVQVAPRMTPPADQIHATFWAPINIWVGRIFDIHSEAPSDAPTVELETIVALAPVLPDLTARSIGLVDTLLDSANKYNALHRCANLAVLFTALGQATWADREQSVVRWACSLFSVANEFESLRLAASVSQAAMLSAFDKLVSTCDADKMKALSRWVSLAGCYHIPDSQTAHAQLWCTSCWVITGSHSLTPP